MTLELPPCGRFGLCDPNGAGKSTLPGVIGALNINTLGIVWNRNPSNYENITQVLAAMEVINPDGSASLYHG